MFVCRTGAGLEAVVEAAPEGGAWNYDGGAVGEE
jgi:hypothetical protein